MLSIIASFWREYSAAFIPIVLVMDMLSFIYSSVKRKLHSDSINAGETEVNCSFGAITPNTSMAHTLGDGKEEA